MLSAPVAHFPLEAPPFRLSMGLASVPFDALAEVDSRYPAQMAERERLLAGPGCLAWVPDTEAARATVWGRVSSALVRAHPALFAWEGGMLADRVTGRRLDPGGSEPLGLAARAVVEDLCVLRPGPDGPVLIAAAVCFPARWRLSDKIGRPLAAIHAPVPGYAGRLRAPVDRFFKNLSPGKMVALRNWSVVADPALHQPADAPATVGPIADAGALYLRVERQTLSRLGDDTLFTIGTHVRSLREACAASADARTLLDAIESMPLPMLDYKGMTPLRDAACAWLRHASAAA